jgi:hypothetical protein
MNGVSYAGLNVGLIHYRILVTTGLYDRLFGFYKLCRDKHFGFPVPSPFFTPQWRELKPYIYEYNRDKYDALADLVKGASKDHPGRLHYERMLNKEYRSVDKSSMMDAFNHGVIRECLTGIQQLNPESSLSGVTEETSARDLLRDVGLKNPSDFHSVTFRIVSVNANVGKLIGNPDPSKRRRRKQLDDNQTHIAYGMRLLAPVCGKDYLQLLISTKSIDEAGRAALTTHVDASNDGRNKLIRGTRNGLVDPWESNFSSSILQNIQRPTIKHIRQKLITEDPTEN